MPRQRNQTRRRQELVLTADALVREKGLAAVQLCDIAQAAGLTPASVLYYYPNINQLFAEAYERAADRFVVGRERAVTGLADPVAQLATAIQLGMPTDSDDDLVRALYQFERLALRDEHCAYIAWSYFERQVAMYTSILERGAALGVFTFAVVPGVIARMLIGIEDGIGFYVVIGRMTVDEVTAIAFAQAASATGITTTHLLASLAALRDEPSDKAD